MTCIFLIDQSMLISLSIIKNKYYEIILILWKNVQVFLSNTFSRESVNTVVQFMLIYFSLIVKQAIYLLNHARIRSWKQPVLSNESKVSCSRKQWRPLMGLEFTTDRYPAITSRTYYPLHLHL